MNLWYNVNTAGMGEENGLIVPHLSLGRAGWAGGRPAGAHMSCYMDISGAAQTQDTRNGAGLMTRVFKYRVVGRRPVMARHRFIWRGPVISYDL